MDDIMGRHIREAMQAANIQRVDLPPCARCGGARYLTTTERFVRLHYVAPCGCDARHSEMNWHEAAQLVKSNPDLAPRFGLKADES